MSVDKLGSVKRRSAAMFTVGLLGASVYPALSDPGLPAGAPATPVLTGRVAHLHFSGNAHLSAATLARFMQQQEGDAYDTTRAERDRQALAKSGYFVRVSLNAAVGPQGGVDETYAVTENPVVTRIVFTRSAGSALPVPSDALKARMSVKEGQVLNTEALFSDLRALFDPHAGWLRSQGFALTASPDVNISPDTGVLTIPLPDPAMPGRDLTEATGAGAPEALRLSAIGIVARNGDGTALRTRGDYATFLMRLLPFLGTAGNTTDQNAEALHRNLTGKLAEHPAQISDLITLLREYTPELRSAGCAPAGALQWLDILRQKPRG